MAGLLGDIYSTIDSTKRKLSDFVQNPVESTRQFIFNRNEDAGKQLGLLDQSFRGANGQLTIGPQTPQAQAAHNQLTDGLLSAMMGATVWHGSPHKFNKFDSSKIGTGEGAQAYGHGLYLAENKSVADEYAGKLSKPIVDFSKKSAQDKYEMAIAKKLQSLAETTQSGSKYDALAKQFDSYLNPRLEKWNPKHPNANAYNGMAPLEGDDLTNAIAYRDAAKRLGEFDLGDAGALYKVDLPDEAIAKMLDWDKPLSAQSKEVQAGLKQYLGPEWDKTWDSLQGVNAYDVLANGRNGNPTGSIEAAEKLRKAGIPGIRYLDGGSRTGGAGTSNYVVFPGNEGLLKILERNGQGLLGN